MELKLENINSFSNAIFPLIRYHDTADLKYSPTMFSLIISSHFPHIITSLQIMPPFFTHFLCINQQIYQCRISIKRFYDTMIAMKHAFYSSMTLSLEQPFNHISLQFHNSRIDQQLVRELSLKPSREEDIGKIDYGIFVSIDSQVFKRIATELDDFNALVTLTNSQVKFTAEGREISLHKERNECIIGGLAKGEETRFFVYLNPIIFFRDLANQTKRIWIFKSPDSFSIIVAPIGLYAQFCVYFSNRGKFQETKI